MQASVKLSIKHFKTVSKNKQSHCQQKKYVNNATTANDNNKNKTRTRLKHNKLDVHELDQAQKYRESKQLTKHGNLEKKIQ